MIKNEILLVQQVLRLGGSIKPLMLPPKAFPWRGGGVMNPSVYVDKFDNLLTLVRVTNYTLHHSEKEMFNHRFGPMQYIHPEHDKHLRTENFILNEGGECIRIDTSNFDPPHPASEFIGLEDARLFHWNGDLYMCGVRRDTDGSTAGRMTLSKLHPATFKELTRVRLKAPKDHTSYLEKNWMPVLDRPFHFVKWTRPTEVVSVHPITGDSQTVKLDLDNPIMLTMLPDLRGGSQVLWRDQHFFAIVHETAYFQNINGQKNGIYRHRFVRWNSHFELRDVSEPFSFFGTLVEFCCGMAVHKENLLISFGHQDNAAFILSIPLNKLDELATCINFLI